MLLGTPLTQNINHTEQCGVRISQETVSNDILLYVYNKHNIFNYFKTSQALPNHTPYIEIYCKKRLKGEQVNIQLSQM